MMRCSKKPGINYCASVCMALTGDKKLANDLIGVAIVMSKPLAALMGMKDLPSTTWPRLDSRARDHFDTGISGPYAFDWGGLYPTFV